MTTEIWVNIGSGTGLLPDGTNPSSEPMLISHQHIRSSDIYLRAISRHQSLKLAWKLLIQNFTGIFQRPMSYFPCWMWSCSVSVVGIMLLYASPRATAICNNLLWGRERSCLISLLACNGGRIQADKYTGAYVHGLMQQRCNSSSLAMELHLFCIKPPIWHIIVTSPRD